MPTPYDALIRMYHSNVLESLYYYIIIILSVGRMLYVIAICRYICFSFVDGVGVGYHNDQNGSQSDWILGYCGKYEINIDNSYLHHHSVSSKYCLQFCHRYTPISMRGLG